MFCGLARLAVIRSLAISVRKAHQRRVVIFAITAGKSEKRRAEAQTQIDQLAALVAHRVGRHIALLRAAAPACGTSSRSVRVRWSQAALRAGPS